MRFQNSVILASLLTALAAYSLPQNENGGSDTYVFVHPYDFQSFCNSCAHSKELMSLLTVLSLRLLNREMVAQTPLVLPSLAMPLALLPMMNLPMRLLLVILVPILRRQKLLPLPLPRLPLLV